MYTQMAFVTSVRGITFLPQIAANASLSFLVLVVATVVFATVVLATVVLVVICERGNANT